MDVQAERAKGERGRFPAGLPRVSDSSLLFLCHLISKMRTDGPSRIGIVLNGSPLLTGGAGSGESEIRRWILQNDWLEAIVALPTDMFDNTGIATYIWILSNCKAAHPLERKGRDGGENTVISFNPDHLNRLVVKAELPYTRYHDINTIPRKDIHQWPN